jgi:acetoin:2,6-dichlorophenolindophenol oxidoreductase subunit beta
MTKMHYWRAVNTALDQAMDRDDRVVVFGEDVGLPGGAFGVTRGLQAKYGQQRIWDTPISESAFIGCATGAAMTGLRPVVEILFMDFLLVAMDQLVNHTAKIRYLSNGQYEVPMVIRTASGVVPGASAQHCQFFDSWMAGVPGLQVVAPSTPQDAYSLLTSAIANDDPVVVLEHRTLYMGHGEVDLAKQVPLGRAAVRREGSDLTILSWSRAVNWALEAADQLAGQGLSAEVVDLRSLRPLDTGLIMSSAARTGRVVVVEESATDGGFGGELAAQLREQLPEVRVARVGSAFAPVTPSLVGACLPSVDAIAAAATRLCD